MKDERGEIATLLTIGTLVVIGVTAVVSSLFVNNKNTIGSRASTGCTANLQCSTYGGSAYTGVFSMKDSNYYPCSDCSCTSKGQSGWIGVCTKTGTGSGGTFSFSCSYNEKIVGEATQCTATTACGSSEVVGDKVDTENAKRHCCCKPASSGGTHDPACSIPANGNCPASCANGCEACSAPDSSFMKCKPGASYPDPKCDSNTMRQGAGDCYTICQSHNESYVGPSTTDGTTGHKCCCKPASGAAATCNTTKTFCTNQCGGNTDTSTGYYTGKDSKAGKSYENSDCSGTELDLSKFCCKGAAACGGATEANMCPDGNNVRNKCIGSTSGQYKCCGPHDNKEYPTANYATWNSTGTCGGATGLENLPAGCCFTDTDCNKYGSGQVCNIPNGSCGGAGGKSCNSNKKGKYQQQCVNQQCVNQPCDGPDDECDKSKYCANSTACQQQYGGFSCPEKDTGNNGQAVYSWADGNGTKCVCMNCKVYGNAPNYNCGSDTQNNYDGSLCCQKEPAKSGAACSAYNQNTCGIKDKPCCTGAGINPCKTSDLSCDKVSNTCKTTCELKTCDNSSKQYRWMSNDPTSKYMYYPNDTNCTGPAIANLSQHCGGCSEGSDKFDCTNYCNYIPKTGGGDASITYYKPKYGDSYWEDSQCTKSKTINASICKCGTTGATASCTGSGTPCNTHCSTNNSGTPYAQYPNRNYWFASNTNTYSSDYNGTCATYKIEDICGTCSATAAPAQGTGTGSCNGQGTPCNTYCKNTDANKPNAQYPSRNYWSVNNTYSSDYSGTCTAYNKAEDICGTCSATTPASGAPATGTTGDYVSCDKSWMTCFNSTSCPPGGTYYESYKYDRGPCQSTYYAGRCCSKVSADLENKGATTVGYADGNVTYFGCKVVRLNVGLFAVNDVCFDYCGKNGNPSTCAYWVSGPAFTPYTVACCEGSYK